MRGREQGKSDCKREKNEWEGGGEYVRHAESPGVHSVTEAFLT